MRHASATDATTRLYRKSHGKEPKLSYLGHVLVKGRNDLLRPRCHRTSSTSSQSELLALCSGSFCPNCFLCSGKGFGTRLAVVSPGHRAGTAAFSTARFQACWPGRRPMHHRQKHLSQGRECSEHRFLLTPYLRSARLTMSFRTRSLSPFTYASQDAIDRTHPAADGPPDTSPEPGC